MINPTIALTATSGRQERVVLARRFHIHTLLTCHDPAQINLSQNTSINESMIIAKRHEGARPPTRIVSLDRFPSDEREASELHRCLAGCAAGLLPDGWGEVSEWPTERIEAGDWSAAAFRSPELADAAACIANRGQLLPQLSMTVRLPCVRGGRAIKKCSSKTLASYPVLSTNPGCQRPNADQGWPDSLLLFHEQDGSDGCRRSGGLACVKIAANAGHLLLTTDAHKHGPPDRGRKRSQIHRARLDARAGDYVQAGQGGGRISELDRRAASAYAESGESVGLPEIQSRCI